eukprot:6636289-Prymnesium_polylepis.1
MARVRQLLGVEVLGRDGASEPLRGTICNPAALRCARAGRQRRALLALFEARLGCPALIVLSLSRGAAAPRGGCG